MFVCGVNDFAIKDVLRPEYQRTRRNLSALVNFERFRFQIFEERRPIMDEYVCGSRVVCVCVCASLSPVSPNLLRKMTPHLACKGVALSS